MSHALLVVVLLSMLAGCAARPESFIARTPTPLNDAYTCALRMVNQLGFTVVNADRAAGFINAEQQTTGGVAAFFTGIKEVDQLRISTYEDGQSGGTAIRVTAGQGTRSANAYSTVSDTNMSAPSDSGREAARAILAACGNEPAAERGTAHSPAVAVPTTETDSGTIVAVATDTIVVPAVLSSKAMRDGRVQVRARSADPGVRLDVDELTVNPPAPLHARDGAWWLAGGFTIGLLTWGALTLDFVM